MAEPGSDGRSKALGGRQAGEAETVGTPSQPRRPGCPASAAYQDEASYRRADSPFVSPQWSHISRPAHAKRPAWQR